MNFTYSPERLAALERSITRERLSWYLGECGGDIELALRMYELNTRISAAFYGSLQGLEILVRNDMNLQLQAAFGESWHDLSAIRLRQTQSDDVHKTINGIGHDDPSNGAIVAELPFAFWVGLLGPNYENEIWRKALYKAFQNRPRGTEQGNRVKAHFVFSCEGRSPDVVRKCREATLFCLGLDSRLRGRTMHPVHPIATRYGAQNRPQRARFDPAVAQPDRSPRKNPPPRSARQSRDDIGDRWLVLC